LSKKLVLARTQHPEHQQRRPQVGDVASITMALAMSRCEKGPSSKGLSRANYCSN